MRILSVCSSVRPSVCLWNAWIMTKKDEKFVCIFILYGSVVVEKCIKSRRTFNINSFDLFTAKTYIKIPVALIISYKNCSQWRRQNFSAVGAQPGHQSSNWDTFRHYALLAVAAPGRQGSQVISRSLRSWGKSSGRQRSKGARSFRGIGLQSNRIWWK